MRTFARATWPAVLLLLALTGCPGPEGGEGDPDGELVGEPDGGPGPVDASVPPRDPVPLKVMTWNVHDLFDEANDPAKNDTVLTSAQVSTKLGQLATVIKRGAPDVLALQEVETFDLLRRLDERLAPLSLPNRALVPAKDPRGINVALMSKLPIAQVVSHVNDRLFAPNGSGPRYFSRDCLEVHLDIGKGRTAVVLVNHQVSQLEGSDSDLNRQAQALGTRNIGDALRAADPTRSVFITGDMNDDPGSATMLIYFNGGAWVDVATSIASTNRWTYEYGAQHLRYDYVIPDQGTAGCTASILHGTDVTAASDHEPALATCMVK